MVVTLWRVRSVATSTQGRPAARRRAASSHGERTAAATGSAGSGGPARGPPPRAGREDGGGDRLGGQRRAVRVLARGGLQADRELVPERRVEVHDVLGGEGELERL